MIHIGQPILLSQLCGWQPCCRGASSENRTKESESLVKVSKLFCSYYHTCRYHSKMQIWNERCIGNLGMQLTNTRPIRVYLLVWKHKPHNPNQFFCISIVHNNPSDKVWIFDSVYYYNLLKDYCMKSSHIVKKKDAHWGVIIVTYIFNLFLLPFYFVLVPPEFRWSKHSWIRLQVYSYQFNVRSIFVDLHIVQHI